jgi:pimeloyl-ACP methyl ester carboxylesterase
MQAQLAAVLISLTWLSLILPAGAGERDGKPVRKTIRADDGVSIVCEVRGKGDTALVFLHGWCGERDYWKNQADVFAADYQIVTLDQAGHGESGKDRKAWSVNGLGDDVAAVAKALGLKHVILIGHSMGGPVGLAAAKRMPGKVMAVIGVDTLQNAERKTPEDAAKKFIALFENDFAGTMRAGLSGLVHEKADSDLVKWLSTRAAAQDPKMAVALMRDMQSLDQTVLLKEAGVPVRCINSGGGYKFFTPTSVAANKKYADFDAVIMESVGHYPMLERPGEFNEKLRAVLKDLSSKK